MSDKMTPEELEKIDRARHLLPEPGAEVVGKLIAEIRDKDEKLKRQSIYVDFIKGLCTRAGEYLTDEIDSSAAKDAEITALKTTLYFYACADNHVGSNSVVGYDGGERARNALKEADDE